MERHHVGIRSQAEGADAVLLARPAKAAKP
jgi:hypothetical protein